MSRQSEAEEKKGQKQEKQINKIKERDETNDRKAPSRYEVPSVNVVRRAAMVMLDRSEAVSGHLFLDGGPRTSLER